MKTQTIGYIRVSTIEQATERQLDGRKLDRVFEEKLSGVSASNRPQLQEMIAYAREGDVIEIHAMDRLARSLKDLMAIVEQLNTKGATVYFVSEGLKFSPDKSNPYDTLMMQVMGAVAEFERSILKSRQAEGIAKAKAKGAYKGVGRKRALTKSQVALLSERMANGESPADMADEFHTSRETIYRRVKEFRKAA